VNHLKIKIPRENLGRKHCAEGFNPGVKGLKYLNETEGTTITTPNKVTYPIFVATYFNTLWDYHEVERFRNQAISVVPSG
jgi:hypothetical protein